MPRTLLLADDSITIQKVVSITFAAEDFTVVTVDNGEDAFARARELRPAIVIADVAMPRRNGYELSQAMKSDPELRGIPVLLLAGTFEPLDPAKAAASQANGHLAKPFDTQALIDKVAELLGAAPAAAGAVQLPAPVAQAPAVARQSAPAWAAGAAARPQPMAPPPQGGAPQRPVPLSPPQARPSTSPFGVPAAAPAAPHPAASMPLAPSPPPPRAALPLTSPFPNAPSAVPMRPAASAAPVPPATSPFSPPRAPAPMAAPSPFPSAAAPRPSAPIPTPMPLGRVPTSPAIPLTSPNLPSPARVPVPFPAASQSAPPPSAATNLWGAPPQGRSTQPLPLQPPAPVAFTPPAAPARIPMPMPVPLPAPTARPAAAIPPAQPPAAQPPAWSAPAPAPTAPESFTPEPFGIPGFDAPSFDTSFDMPSEVSGMAEAAAAASVQSSPADLSLDIPMEEEPPELLPEIDGFELGSSQNLDVSMTGGSASAFISGELSDFSQQGGLAPVGGLDFDGSAGAEQPIELASPHEFLDSPAPDPFAATAPLSIPRATPQAAPVPVRVPMPAVPPAAAAAPAQADGEAALRLALSQASREVIERVVWEVVPQLAEVILREHVERMERERSQ